MKIVEQLLSSQFLSSRPWRLVREAGQPHPAIVNAQGVVIARLTVNAMADDAALIIESVNALPRLIERVQAYKKWADDAPYFPEEEAEEAG